MPKINYLWHSEARITELLKMAQKKTDKFYMKTKQQILKDLCHLFLHFMAYTKKFSKHSLKAYTTDLHEFLDLKKPSPFTIPEKPILVTVKNKKQLEKTIKSLIEKNMTKHSKLAHSSRSRKLAVIKSFIKWLAEQNYIDEDFRHLFKSPKVPLRVPFFLSVDEIFSIMEMFKKEKGKVHTARDKALFFLLYGGGLRVSEACYVKVKNIDWENRTIKIKGKGNKERLVCFPKKAMENLKALKTNHTYLFGHKPLSERKAYDIIKSIGQKTGLLKPLHPHALRHSFATHMLTGGSNLRILQKLLGHKTLSSTQKYTHLDLAHLSQTLEMYHPFQKNQQ